MSAIDAGRRLGPYEIVSRLGAGGMGEVWRAKDTRLDRTVAVKVLPAALAQNAQFKLRFDREARTISQLNHPNICTLFDIGEAATDPESSVSYIVMELIEGESLADRLLRGPMPMSEAMRVGMQIADALDKAHRAGIVHRDLKPGNVMLTKGGAKLLDFGLAKSNVVAMGGEDMTQARPLTQEGTILGTFQYMAPEQLEGTEADARSDIFALGAILYEMATGRRAFDGKTKTSLIAAIIDRDPPPIASIQPLTPPAFEHVVAKCLAKDPDDRWQSAHDVAEELRWISSAGSQAGVAAPVAMKKRSRERMAWAIAALLAIAVIAVGAMYFRLWRAASRQIVTNIAPPPGRQFNATGDISGPPTISPDGRSIVFSIHDDGPARLWIRSLVTGKEKMLAGTEAATFPFWSADSKSIGFDNGERVMRVDASGGPPVPLGESFGGRGGTWSVNDEIVWAPTAVGPLVISKANGSGRKALTKLGADETSHRWPQFLPDGKHLIYLAANHKDPTGSSNGIYIVDTTGGTPRMVMRGVSNAAYSDGYLLFVRDQVLYAQKMSLEGVLKGDPVAIADELLYDSGIWRVPFSVSNDGTLVYLIGKSTALSHLRWVDRRGATIEEIGEAGAYWDLELSRDGKRIAVVIGDPLREMWIFEADGKRRTRQPIDANWIDTGVWSPDGTKFYGALLRSGQFCVIERNSSTGTERVLRRTTNTTSVRSVSPDGRYIFTVGDNGEIAKVSVADGTMTPILKVALGRSGSTSSATLSPDGRWLAYVTAASGRAEVFVAFVSNPEVRWQISSAGGTLPRFRADGHEVFFVDPSNHLVAVPLAEKGDELEIGSAQQLFGFHPRPQAISYDVSADGQRFIVNEMTEESSATAVVVPDWKQRLNNPLQLH